jgi:2-polyprenyl-3-methyl-5-hydroxy-6-metoxy-1,4-benzoquinol methylase
VKDAKKGGGKAPLETNAVALRVSLLPRAARLIKAEGELRLPCLPSMLEQHQKTLLTIFEQLGRPFTADEAGQLRRIIEKKLPEGFAKSQYARLLVKYRTEPPPHPGIDYEISIAHRTIEEEYAEWVEQRDPPLFGAHPDAKVMKLAGELGGPKDVAVLDVGAGTGRNTLPLARAGYPTDAVEIAPALAKVLRAEAKKERLAVDVLEGDILDTTLAIEHGKYKLIVLAEVVASHFRDVDQVRRLAERAVDLLAPGGILLFSAFLAQGGYKPDQLAREFSQTAWCTIYTRAELDRAMEGLALDRVADESVHDYEKQHLPPEQWPPTGWFVQWSLGSDVFGVPVGRAPLELRWLSYRRRG